MKDFNKIFMHPAPILLPSARPAEKPKPKPEEKPKVDLGWTAPPVKKEAAMEELELEPQFGIEPPAEPETSELPIAEEPGEEELTLEEPETSATVLDTTKEALWEEMVKAVADVCGDDVKLTKNAVAELQKTTEDGRTVLAEEIRKILLAAKEENDRGGVSPAVGVTPEQIEEQTETVT